MTVRFQVTTVLFSSHLFFILIDQKWKVLCLNVSRGIGVLCHLGQQMLCVSLLRRKLIFSGFVSRGTKPHLEF